MKEKREYLHGLDIIRIACAFMVFIFHLRANINCDFRWLNDVVGQSASWMTIFFVMSGFITCYNYSGITNEEILPFIKKRFLTFLPDYLIVSFYWYILSNQHFSLLDLELLPHQLFMIHAMHIYPYLINSGTWFFSCIMFCYVAFPYIQNLSRIMSKKRMTVAIIVISSFIFTIAYITKEYMIFYYDNPIYRIMEFSVGALLANIVFRDKEKGIYLKKIERIPSTFLVLIIVSLSVTLFLGINALVKYNYTYHIEFYTVIIMIILLLLSCVNKKGIWGYFEKSKPIAFLAKCSLEFWVAQTITMQICYRKLRFILEGQSHSNLKMILYAFIINSLITLVLYYIRINISRKLVKIPLWVTIAGAICLYGLLFLFAETNLASFLRVHVL